MPTSSSSAVGQIGAWIRARRRELDLTQAQLADRVGVTQTQISTWETSKTHPNSGHFTALKQVLGDSGPASVGSPRVDPRQGQASQVADVSLVPGLFVRPQNDDSRGIGKVATVQDGTAVVAHFHSLTNIESVQYPVETLKPVRLQAQTRCFVKDSTGKWRVGRIGSSSNHGEYEVLLPDREALYIHAERLFVRSALAVEDPLDVLILGAQESPFLHDRRREFLKSVIQQRAVAHGMTGLLSSRIELYPHQIAVVRRVLEDPIQRYLLADEVGLGKTIEAGVILRQYLLDHTEPKALVIVPPMLVEQWRTELNQKFQASAWPNAVRLLTSDNLQSIDSNAGCGLLIIDEAHHLAALGFAEEGTSRQLFQKYCDLARSAERVLLLTATPVLHHERDFLAMLHLLDPERYPLDRLDSFRRRVEKRQAVGRMLRALRADLTNIALIRLNLTTLRREFEDDRRLATLADEVERTASSTESAGERAAAIQAVRLHISETYRLHRRMVRTRRLSVEDGSSLIAPRFDDNAKAAPLIEEHDLDSRAEHVHDLLETWRSGAAASVAVDSDGSERATELRLSLQRLFLLLFQSAGSSLTLLAAVVRSRQAGNAAEPLGREFTQQDVRTICNTPLFEGEAKILDDLLEVLQQTPVHTRIDLIIDLIRTIDRSTPRGKAAKVAVFTMFTSVCIELTARFVATFGPHAVVSHQDGRSPGDIEVEIQRFCDRTSDCRFLIVDRSGEEGRNFQSADFMIHFDLPWSPNRLEQRIGRLDRIGRTRGVRARVCLGPDTDASMFDAWFRVLRDGFGIFSASIAALQFFVDTRLPELEKGFFSGGTAFLDSAIAQIRDEVAAEHVRLSDQDAVDDLDALVKDPAGYAQALTELDSQHEVIGRAMDGWAREALKLSAVRDANTGTVTYTPTRQSLVPADVLLERFQPLLNGYRGSFEREVTTMLPNVAMLRVGDPLVDALAGYMRWDDRGQAFAVWRQHPSWPATEGAEWLGFRFNYVIEADTRHAQQVAAEKLPTADQGALRRRADAWFAPRLRTLFLDVQGQLVRDPALLKVIAAPYRAVKNGGRDINLAKDKAALIGVCLDVDLWPDLCRRVRDASRELLLGSAGLRTAVASSVSRAQGELAARVEQIHLRSTEERQVDGAFGRERHEADVERELGDALIEGIKEPYLRLDSVGFIVVSGREVAVTDRRVVGE
jgi:ATP-dependent helicase HepA